MSEPTDTLDHEARSFDDILFDLMDGIGSATISCGAHEMPGSSCHACLHATANDIWHGVQLSALADEVEALRRERAPYEPPCEVDRAKARHLADDPDAIEDHEFRNLARAFRLEADARRRGEEDLREYERMNLRSEWEAMEASRDDALATVARHREALRVVQDFDSLGEGPCVFCNGTVTHADDCIQERITVLLAEAAPQTETPT